MSEGSAHGLLEMPCLGRPFQLGMLYDCRNDSLIPGVTLWGPDTLGTAKHAMMEGSDFEIITEDSFSQKTLHLDVSAGLKLSVLGGLVKAGGSGKFLYDRTTSKNQARVSLRYKSTSRFEQLNMSQLGKFEYPRVFDDDIATHVVTAVQYGADAVFVFDRQVDSTEKFYQVHGNLEAMISVLPSIDLQVGGSADLNEGVEKIQCKFYGDLILPKNPTTYQDAVRVYQELPKLLAGASVPKKVWLYPLSKLDSRVQRMVRDINSQLIDDLQDVMESLHELEMQINDLVISEVCLIFAQIKGCLEKMKRLIGSYKMKTMKNLSTLLPNVRGGCEEEAKLAELLEDNGTSPFSSEHISSWIGSKVEEIAVLGQYLIELEKYPIKLAFMLSELISLTSGFTGDSVLCFDFNISVERDVQLVRMEAYLHGKSLTKEQELEPNLWYKSPKLRHQFQRFLRFVDINSDKKGTTYVVTNSSKATTNNLGVMSLFVNSCKTEFEPPDQPGVPCASSKSHNSLQLSWARPKYGGSSVQTYTVSYHTVDDPPAAGHSQWSTQTSSEECLVLTNLTPGSLYYFKVTAESAVGSSPESEVGEERLPPDQPGKPETTEKIHNSLQLRWSKPEHGASIVSSYTVHYQSVTDQPGQWSTQTSSEECLVLTKLTPGSLHHFKVTAESAVGSSPESEVGEEMLPPDQPGKPQVGRKSHNTIELEWEEPKHGADAVQSYIFYYCSENENEKWLSKTTNKPSIYLSGITPGTLYYLKVKAKSDAGLSPISEESEVRLPPDQPGIPETITKAHNELQLKWTKPKHGASIVRFYTVHYRSVADQWSTQTSSEECLVLTKLTPGSLYHVKVTAESAVGSSPESDVGKERLPPDQPGKPNGSCVTYNSIQLNWTQPKHGAESVQCYTISYQSVNARYQTLKTTSKHECVTLSNLAPRTVYTFKVRAESAAGSGPEGELSDPVETLTPSLGKPQVSKITHNSVQLNWEKPSECVLLYTVSYCCVDDHSPTDPAVQWHGQVFPNNSCNVSLGGLLPNTKYVFKVRGETHEGTSPESELSNFVKTLQLLPPPGKPYATNISYESFQLNWKKPSYDGILHYTISYLTEDDPTKTCRTLVTKDSSNKYHFTAGHDERYIFKVSAVATTGHSAESEESGRIKAKSKPCGTRVLHSYKAQNVCVYQLPYYNCKAVNRLASPHSKVLMVVGATGAGKSTLINGMANYIMGVDWEDEYRFKLIPEETDHDQTKSQTKCITAYTFYKDEGSTLPYTLTVIDTPGLGGTEGLERDKEIVSQIKKFFSLEGIDQLHGIGFVTQAPLARLTPTQRYVFDSILSVFGKDVADNIFLMVTFADGKQPPVLDVVRRADLPFNSYFKYNNSALYASNKSEFNEFDYMFWKMGEKSYKDFFDMFVEVKPINLRLTREVLKAREYLKVSIQELQSLIQARLTKLDELQEKRQLLKNDEAAIMESRDCYTYTVQVTKQRKIDLRGQYTLNCLNCNLTCEDNCLHINEMYKSSVMNLYNRGTKKATCRVCRCSWREHVCYPYKLETYQETETRTVAGVKAKYESAMISWKNETEAMIKKMSQELKQMHQTVLQKIDEVKGILERLQEIALRPDPLTQVDYVDLFIEYEKIECRPGWRERVSALEQARKQAEILSTIAKQKQGINPFFSID